MLTFKIFSLFFFFSFDQYFSNTISRLLLPVEGAHVAACEEMGTAISNVEGAAHKGLLQCIDTVMSEVCVSRLAPYVCMYNCQRLPFGIMYQ